jgi:hypothetical protein
MNIFKHILAGLAGALIVGVLMAIIFTGYGGNHCDQPPVATCECFCCHLFGLRGYEACGRFGLYAGLALGGILGAGAAWLYAGKKDQ